MPVSTKYPDLVPKRKIHPVALTIAGSDSGGGAGAQADLKTFDALGVHGTTAITCVTAQNPRGVLAIKPCPAILVRQQLEAVFAEFPPAAAKAGMLFSASIIRVVTNFFGSSTRPPLIVDPVLVATSGARLLRGRAMRSLQELFSVATLITPNLHETQILSGLQIKSADDLARAARILQQR